MPRRYATYNFSIGPVEPVTALHQVATLGAFLIAIGFVIHVWNFIQSWSEGPILDDEDPWDLKETSQYTREWRWHSRRLKTTIADGSGEEDADEEGERDLATDGGQETEDTEESAESENAGS
jgi:cytochrome c oxidase subunit 1